MMMITVVLHMMFVYLKSPSTENKHPSASLVLY